MKYKTKTESEEGDRQMEIAETGTNNKLWSQPPEKVFRGESRCGQQE